MSFLDQLVKVGAVQVFAGAIWLSEPLGAAQYLIDIGGSSPPMDREDETHDLRVTGTIDVDVTTDVIHSSCLWFHHHNDPPIPLPLTPTHIRNGGVDFVESNGALFLAFRDSTGPLGNVVSWDVYGHSNASLWLQSCCGIDGDPFVSLRFARGQLTETTFDLDDVLHGGFGAPIKLGIAVPEPSDIVFFLAVSIAASAVRGTQGRNRHANFCTKFTSILVEC